MQTGNDRLIPVHRRILAVVASVVVVLSLTTAADATAVSLTEIASFVGGGQISGRDLAGNGVIVGSADIGGSNFHAFRRAADGTLTDLGVLGTGSFSGAAAVNEAGTIVGTSATVDAADRRAFVWTESTGMTDLGLLSPGDIESSAVDINTDGWIVGNGDTDAWVRDPAVGELVVIDPLPTATIMQAVGINDDGGVIGSAFVPGGIIAFQWTASGGTVALPLPDGATSFRPSGINGYGQVVGTEYGGSTGYRTWLWDPVDGYTELFGPPGFASVFAKGLNDDGVAVGFAEVDGSGDRVMAVWDTKRSTTATIVPSPTPGSIDAQISVINSSGSVLGFTNDVVDDDDYTRTFLGQVVVAPGPATDVFRSDCLGPVQLTWQPPAFDGYGTVRYIVQRDGVTITEVATTSYQDDPHASTVQYTVIAVNDGGEAVPAPVVRSEECPPSKTTPTTTPVSPRTVAVVATPQFTG